MENTSIDPLIELRKLVAEKNIDLVAVAQRYNEQAKSDRIKRLGGNRSYRRPADELSAMLDGTASPQFYPLLAVLDAAYPVTNRTPVQNTICAAITSKLFDLIEKTRGIKTTGEMGRGPSF